MSSSQGRSQPQARQQIIWNKSFIISNSLYAVLQVSDQMTFQVSIMNYTSGIKFSLLDYVCVCVCVYIYIYIYIYIVLIALSSSVLLLTVLVSSWFIYQSKPWGTTVLEPSRTAKSEPSRSHTRRLKILPPLVASVVPQPIQPFDHSSCRPNQ
jgi:hypothetical protein